jgi:hypothetical protein
MEASDLDRTRMKAEFKQILAFCDQYNPHENDRQRQAKALTKILVGKWYRHLRSPFTSRAKITKIRDEYWPVRAWIVRPEEEE